MRGQDGQTGSMFSYVDLEERSAPPVSDLGSDLQGRCHKCGSTPGSGPDSGRVRQQLAPESDAADKDEKKSQMNIT
jgi:hypothetical protein